MYLDEASVTGTETALLAAAAAPRAVPRFVTPPWSRTSSSSASSSREWASSIKATARRRFASKAAARFGGAQHRL